jgi:glycosyltransferase involved in cell wall biosynthesis
MPLQTVDMVLPVFGEAPYLIQTLESIIPELDDLASLIIVEDRPSETTRCVTRNFQNQHPDKVQLILSELPGVANALNCGLEFSNADLIARIDSDDLVIAGRIAKQRKELIKRRLSVLGGQAMFIDENGNRLHPFKTNNPISMLEIHKQMFFRNPISHPSVMFRRDSALVAGGYRDEFEGLEDLDLWIRMSLKGKVRNSKDTYISYRISGKQASKRIKDLTTKQSAILTLLPTQYVRSKVKYLAAIHELERLNPKESNKSLIGFLLKSMQVFTISPWSSLTYFRFRLSSHVKCKWQERMLKG